MERYDPKRKELSARDVVARAIYTEVAQGRGTANRACTSTSPTAEPSTSGRNCRACTPSSWSLQGSTSRRRRWRSRRRSTTRWAESGSNPGTGGTESWVAAPRGKPLAASTGRTGWAGTPWGTSWSSGGGRAWPRPSMQSGSAPARSGVGIRDGTGGILSPFGVKDGKNPFTLKEQVAAAMWKHVGIIRSQGELEQGLAEILAIGREAKNAKAVGSRAYNQSWLNTLQLWNMVLDCEAIIRSAMERKESRGAHTRSDFPEKDDGRWLVNIITREEGGIMSRTCPGPKAPARAGSAHRGVTRRLHHGDGYEEGGEVEGLQRYRRRAARRPTGTTDTRCLTSKGWPSWNLRLHCVPEPPGFLPGRPLELQGGQVRSCSAEVNGMPKLMCMTPRGTGHGGIPGADARVPLHPRPGHGRVLELRVKKTIRPFRAEGRAEGSGGSTDMTSNACGSFESASSVPVPGRVPRGQGTQGRLHRPQVGREGRVPRHAPDGLVNRSKYLKADAGLGYCNITKCCQEICPEHIVITDDTIHPREGEGGRRPYDPLLWAYRKLRGEK